ncbi:unnamed protein product [Caenorhabditis brenneri]
MNVAARFPLLRLPNDERIEVLRHMDPINLVKISFISRRAKEMVISRKFKADTIQVIINSKISICLFYNYEIRWDYIRLPMGNENDGLKKVKKPTHIYFWEYCNPGALIHEWKNDKFEIKDWLEHFHTIFRCKNRGIVFNENASQFDFDSVYNHFKNLDKLEMHGTGNVDYYNRVMKAFVPSKDIRVDLNNFKNENAKKLAPILIQNFENFFGDCSPLGESFGSLTLDDLLCCNSKEVELYEESLSQKDINRFFKLWISGSNRRLERLTIHFSVPDREVPTLDALVEGIKHVCLPDDQVKFFFPDWRRYTVRGGREIMRKDGTKGTVYIHNDNEDQWVHLNVWHDHNCE